MRARGTQCPAHKLTERAVREIRANVKGEPAHALAARYGVHINTIDRIRWGQAWGWVND